MKKRKGTGSMIAPTILLTWLIIIIIINLCSCERADKTCIIHHWSVPEIPSYEHYVEFKATRADYQMWNNRLDSMVKNDHVYYMECKCN